jgi:16S rRNA (cytosine967-C5)-methyltransferase
MTTLRIFVDNDTPKSLSKNHAPVRWKELSSLWKSLLEKSPLPQVDRWLSDEFRKHSRYGSRDRKWYAELVFAAVRYGFLVLFLQEFENVEGIKNQTERFLRAKEHLSEKCFDLESLEKAWRDLPPADFFAWIFILLSREDFARHLPDGTPVGVEECLQVVLTSAERRESKKNVVNAFFKNLETQDKNTEDSLVWQMVASGIPIWFSEFLKARMQQSHWNFANTHQFLQFQNSRPPLWLRLNYPDKAQAVVEELAKESFETQQTTPWTLRAKGAKGIFATEGYRNGVFEIQDLASQGIGQCVNNKPGDFIWDCCAGGGGKTMQLAARQANKGVLYASDVREFKLEEVKKRARRAGFFNIRCLAWQGADLPAFPKEIEKRGGFDWVLVDAPCSSSGTWRRNPDAKFRSTQKCLESLCALQLRILTSAAKAVRKGGHLVYSTCSWIPLENEAIAALFLSENRAFRLVSQELLGAPDADADTMFAAVFVRSSL